MKTYAVLSAFLLLFLTAIAYGQCGSNCVFYGGDLDVNSPNANALSNENDAIVGGDPYGAATYQNFTIQKSDHCCAITAVFSDNLSQLTPSSGYWEFRTGMSEGDGGTLVASGTGAMTHAPTGRSAFGYTEYRDEIAGLNFLPVGDTMYWMAVVPVCASCQGRSFNSNTDGLNGVGTQSSGQQYFNSAFFGANFVNANTQGSFDIFSQGLRGTAWPEPSSFLLMGSGLMAAAAVVRHRLF